MLYNTMHWLSPANSLHSPTYSTSIVPYPLYQSISQVINMRPPNHILAFCCVALRFGYANHPIHGWSLVIARLCVTLLTVGVCGEGGRWWLVVWLFVLCLWKLELTLAVGRIIQDSMVVIVIVTLDENSYILASRTTAVYLTATVELQLAAEWLY